MIEISIGSSGLSRPQRSRAAAMVCSLMCGLRRRIRSGEPGMSLNSMKFRITTNTIVTIALMTLRPR
jgi:hypothetical protein